MINIDNPVLSFYAGKSVLLTGATGFLGRAILSKLLRDVPDIGTIYLLMRKKKDQSISERTQQLLLSIDPVLTKAMADNPNHFLKVKPIAGDLMQAGLGISEDDKALLRLHANIVISCAAEIGFHRPLRSTILTNIQGVVELAHLTRFFESVHAFVHVSTAYTNVEKDLNYEIVSDMPEDVDLILETVNRNGAEEDLILLAPSLKSKLTSYTWSKALAECWLKKNCDSLPLIIIRPSLITGALTEPIPGWVYGKAGAVGLMYAATRGLLKTIPIFEKGIVNLVPVDTVSRTTIAAAWWIDKLDREQCPKVNPVVMYTETSSVCPVYGDAIFQYMRNIVSEQQDIMRAAMLSMPTYGSPSWRSKWTLLHELPVWLLPRGRKRKSLMRLLGQFRTVMGDFAAVNKLRCWFVSKEIIRMNDQLQGDVDKFGHQLDNLSWEFYLRQSCHGALKYL